MTLRSTARQVASNMTQLHAVRAEISTGLDSSTTFQIVQSLGSFTHLREVSIFLLAFSCDRMECEVSPTHCEGRA